MDCAAASQAAAALDEKHDHRRDSYVSVGPAHACARLSGTAESVTLSRAEFGTHVSGSAIQLRLQSADAGGYRGVESGDRRDCVRDALRREMATAEGLREKYRRQSAS